MADLTLSQWRIGVLAGSIDPNEHMKDIACYMAVAGRGGSRPIPKRRDGSTVEIHGLGRAMLDEGLTAFAVYRCVRDTCGDLSNPYFMAAMLILVLDNKWPKGQRVKMRAQVCELYKNFPDREEARDAVLPVLRVYVDVSKLFSGRRRYRALDVFLVNLQTADQWLPEGAALGALQAIALLLSTECYYGCRNNAWEIALRLSKYPSELSTQSGVDFDNIGTFISICKHRPCWVREDKRLWPNNRVVTSSTLPDICKYLSGAGVSNDEIGRYLDHHLVKITPVIELIERVMAHCSYFTRVRVGSYFLLRTAVDVQCHRRYRLFDEKVMPEIKNEDDEKYCVLCIRHLLTHLVTYDYASMKLPKRYTRLLKHYATKTNILRR